MNNMDEHMNISQKASVGSHENTLIGVQNNQYGLTHMQAIEMAFSIFKEYYPQLKKDVLEELNGMVKEKLSSVPEENIVPPTPRIAVPTLQNASITEEVDIRELYANLLANSMNKVVKDGIHPAYVEIIKIFINFKRMFTFREFSYIGKIFNNFCAFPFIIFST